MLMILIVQLVVMIGVRKSLDFIFTKYELKVLDDLMPESNTKHKDEEDEEVTTLVSTFLSRLHNSNQNNRLINTLYKL
jgi:hypothetical protein